MVLNIYQPLLSSVKRQTWLLRTPLVPTFCSPPLRKLAEIRGRTACLQMAFMVISERLISHFVYAERMSVLFCNWKHASCWRFLFICCPCFFVFESLFSFFFSNLSSWISKCFFFFKIRLRSYFLKCHLLKSRSLLKIEIKSCYFTVFKNCS